MQHVPHSIRRWEDPEVTERPHPVEEGVITTSWEDVEPAIVVLDPLEASAPAFQPEVLFADPEAPPYPGVVVIEADIIDAMRPALWTYHAVEHAPLRHPGSLTLSHTEPKVSVGLEPGLQTLTLNGFGLDRGGRGGSVPGGAWLSVRPPRLTSMEWFAALFPILLGAMLAPFWMQTALAVAAGAGMVLVYAAMMMYALRIEPTIAQDAEGHVRIFFCRFGDPDDRLLPGAVLVNRHATSGLFAGAVVLVLSRTSEGTSGVILNKAVTDAHYEEFGGPALFRKAAKVHRGIGGPVSPNVWATYHMLDSVAGATELCPGVFTGGDAGQLLRAGAGQVKVLHGGCGWGPCQLEGEVEAGLWTYADVPLEQVFGPNAPCLWGKLDEQLALLAVADEQPLAA